MLFDWFRRRSAPRERRLTRALPMPLLDLATKDGCWVSARVTDDGADVGFMRRTLGGLPLFDTGWQFYAGDETKEYLADRSNGHLHSVNLVANCDPAIVSFLHWPRGSELLRDGDSFVPTPRSVVTERDFFA